MEDIHGYPIKVGDRVKVIQCAYQEECTSDSNCKFSKPHNGNVTKDKLIRGSDACKVVGDQGEIYVAYKIELISEAVSPSPSKNISPCKCPMFNLSIVHESNCKDRK